MSRFCSSLSTMLNKHVWVRLITVILILEICDDLFVSPLLNYYFGGHFWLVNGTYKCIEFSIALLLNHKILRAKIFVQRPRYHMSLKKVVLVVLLVVYFGVTVLLKHPTRFVTALTVGTIAAIPEEYFWRGLILGYFAQHLHLKSEKRAVYSLVLSSLLFGLYHLSNLHVQPLDGTMAQVLQTVGLGMVLGAVYLKTGNLLTPIIIHFSWDFFVTLVNGISFGSGSPVNWIVTIVISGLLCILGIIILWSNGSRSALIERMK